MSPLALEDASHELFRILAHHVIFIVERLGFLDYDIRKQQLTENCHNL